MQRPAPLIACALARICGQRLQRLDHRHIVGGMDDRGIAEGRKVAVAGSGRQRLNSVKLVRLPAPICAAGKAARNRGIGIAGGHALGPGAFGLVALQIRHGQGHGTPGRNPGAAAAVNCADKVGLSVQTISSASATGQGDRSASGVWP